jgi:hypothetical protein
VQCPAAERATLQIVINDDWLLRTIHRLVALLAKAIGAAREGRVDDARKELEGLYGSELGMPRRMLERLEPSTAVLALGHDKARLFVRLLEADADIASISGDEGLASTLRARASAVTACIPPDRR